MLKHKTRRGKRRARSMRQPGNVFFPRVEQLEDRCLMSTRIWDGGGSTNDWSDPLNWDGDLSAPIASDDAVIGADFAAETISFSSGSATVNSITSEAHLAISGGTFTVNGTSTLEQGFTLSGGTLTGTGTITANGASSWTDGAMTGTGTTTIAAGATAAISGVVAHTFQQRTLDNYGTVTWSNREFVPSNGAAVINRADAVIEFTGGDNYFNNSNAFTFSNYGTILKSGSGVTHIGSGHQFNNYNVLQIAAGSFGVFGGGTNTGDIQIAVGREFLIGSGQTYTFGVGTTISPYGGGTGLVYVSGGTLALASGLNLTLPNFRVGVDSNLTGQGDITITNFLHWQGGMHSSGQTTLTETATGLIDAGVSLVNRTFNNAGTITWQGSSGFINLHASTFYNTGTFRVQNNLAIDSGGPNGSFVNTGTFERIGGGNGVTEITARVNLANDGLVDAQTGMILLLGDGVHTGTFTAGQGDTIKFGGGTHTLTSTSVLAGTGTFDFTGGSTTVGGTVAPGNSPGCLTANGGIAFESTATFAVELNGTTACTEYDQLQVTGTVNLDTDSNGGAFLDVTLGFTPDYDDEFTIIDNDGTSDAVIGTFFGLGEGDVFTVDGLAFEISYVGGDGNDVVITRVNIAPELVANVPLFVPPAGSATITDSNLYVADDNVPSGITYSVLTLPAKGTLKRNGVPVGWLFNPATGHYYRATTPTDWSTASAQAAALGGYLVSIANAAENQWIADNFLEFGQLWIGFTDEASEGNFAWANGESVTYTNWDGGEPNNGLGSNEDHTYMDPIHGRWNDLASNARVLYGVIEVNSAAGLVTTFTQEDIDNGLITYQHYSGLYVSPTDDDDFSFSVSDGAGGSIGATTFEIEVVSTWDGGGADNNWTTAANWVGDVAPSAGADLVFPDFDVDVASFSNINNFAAGTLFNSITFTGDGFDGYFITGNRIILGPGGITTSVDTFGYNTLDLAMTLPADRMMTVNGFTLELSGVISGAGGIVKEGVEDLILSAVNSYSGVTIVNDGELVVDGQIVSDVTVNAFGELDGGGTITRTVTVAGGRLDLHSCLSTGDVSLDSTSIFENEIDGPTPCTELAQLIVTGTVNLNSDGGTGAIFDADLDFDPGLGDSFTLIDNDSSDAVIGTFAGLPEGQIFLVEGTAVQISYMGGDGNDVVLTVVEEPTFVFGIGASGEDQAQAIAVDDAGNTYITGNFTGTVDFDPGAGVTNLGPGGIFVARYGADGNLAWARRVSGQAAGAGIAIDEFDGSVYVTGLFEGTVDFDPGAGLFDLSSSSRDVFVLKLDAFGNFVWARDFDGGTNSQGNAESQGNSIGVDPFSGDVFVTGNYTGTADFDPTGGVDTRTSAGLQDIFVAAFNFQGDLHWVKTLGGPADDGGTGIAVDDFGYLIVVGYFKETVDFDPDGVALPLTSAGGYDFFVMQLDWFDGAPFWVDTFGGTGHDFAEDVAVDQFSGDLAVTGSFTETVDFDPDDVGVFELTSAGARDIFALKLTNWGDLLWAKGWGGSSQDEGVSIAFGEHGDVHTTGHYAGTVDFDPGAGVTNLTSAGLSDVFISKMHGISGDFVAAKSVGGADLDIGLGIAISESDHVHVTGFFSSTGDFDPGPGTTNLTSNGDRDIFVMKLAPMTPAGCDPGALDPTFDFDGMVTTPFGSGDDIGNSMAVQADGKIVVVGVSDQTGTGDLIQDFAVARYNADGSLDASFGTGGKVTTDFEAASDQANAVAIQADGKIIVGGSNCDHNNCGFALARYNTDGSLDTSFSTDGKVLKDFYHSFITSLAVQADGKIVAGGFSWNGTTWDFILARYNSDGTNDASFGTGGRVINDIGPGEDGIKDVAVQADGEIIVAGASFNGSDNDFILARYNSDGSFDAGFGTGGIVTTAIAGDDLGRSLALQADGKIVVAGVSDNDFALARYNADGSLDTTFGAAGKVTTDFVITSHGQSVALQADDKIVVAGKSHNGSNWDFTLARYNSDGSLDTSFGTDGKVISDFGFGDDIAASVAIQPDGAIVVAGQSWNGSNFDFAVVRYESCLCIPGALDETFDFDGKVTTAIQAGIDNAFAVAMQADGKIIVAGQSQPSNTQNDTTRDFALVRHHADGSLDTTFGDGGTVITPIGTRENDAYAVAVQTDGKIVAVGFGHNGADYNIALARYNSDGSLDTDFNGGGTLLTSGIGRIAYAVAIQTDGRIVVAGNTHNNDFVVARFNGDGSADTDFGTSGRVVTDFSTGDDFARSIAIQADGKIVVGGQSYNGSNWDFALARYNSDGSPDNGFGVGGKLRTAIGEGNDLGQSLVLQSDGKIIVTGLTDAGGSYDFALLRYNSDGSLDEGFGSEGRVTTDFGGTSNDEAQSVALQADGKILVAGASNVAVSNYDFALARYNRDGSLDTSFGIAGKTTTDFGSGNDYGAAVTVQADGKIIVAGASFNGTNLDFAVARYESCLRIWDGGGANDFWSTPENWVGDVAPMAGDDLVFADGADRKTNVNDFAADTNFHSIVFTGDSYSITGNRITVGSGGLVQTADIVSYNTFQLPVLLNSDLAVTVDGLFYMSGVLSSAGGLIKNGAGSLRLLGDNSYAGTTIINDGFVILDRDTALGSTDAGTTVMSGAGLSINVAAVTGEGLTLDGGTLAGGFSNATWAAPIVLESDSVVGPITIQLTLSGVISGSGGLIVEGGVGKLIISNANSYTGATTINPGTLLVNGTLASGVTVNSGGALGGTGALDFVAVNEGTVAPGESPGCLSAGDIFFDANSTFAVELNGTTACTEYDQLRSSGTDDPEFGFAAGFGAAAFDEAHGVAYDTFGNVYTIGYFSGTVDFDPGPGTATLMSGTGLDVFVSKLDATGNFVWARQFGGTSDAIGYSIAADVLGNVYATGYFFGTADFDPGAGTLNLTSAGNEDVFVSKLDSAGNFVWARRLGGTSSDVANDIEPDESGNVHVTGYFVGTADFDPGVGTSNLTSAGADDAFIAKLDSGGNFVWARQLGGASNHQGLSIALDGSGNVYTTGHFLGTADFDPGAGTTNLTSAGSNDVFVSKLDANGNFVWARQLGGTNSDFGYGVVTGNSGNVYVVGHFSGSADFDPGAGTLTLTSAGAADIFVSCLDSSGSFVWARQMGGTGSDIGLSIAMDGSGNVYATGFFNGTADFDPGAGTSTLTSAGGADIFVSKLNANGNFVWTRQMGGTSSDRGNDIDVDGSGNVYTTGFFGSTADFDPGAGTSTLPSAGSADGFVSKLTQASLLLGGATLDISLGFTPAIGDEFIIIDNDEADPVYGTFAGLAEGDTFIIDGVTFRISYAGGDGNDVVLTVTSLIRLVGEVFFGGANDQRGTDIAVANGQVYVSANQQPETQDGNSSAYVIKYGIPPGADPDWSRNFAFGTMFHGITATNEGVYAVGLNYSLSSDGVGGKESKSILAKFPLDGSNGPASGGATWITTPNFFSYTGVEGFEDVIAVVENGTTYLYAVGAGQPCSYSAYIIAKFDTAGNRIAAATDSSVGVAFNQCSVPSVGGSNLQGATVLNGNIFAVGGSAWSHEGDSPGRPTLYKYDSNLNLLNRNRQTGLAGWYNAVTTLGNAVFAAGHVNGNNQDYLIGKYDEAGDLIWDVTFGGTGADQLTGIVAIGERLFAVGHTASAGAGGADSILFEIDPDTGDVLSEQLYGGAQDDKANGISTDGTDLFVVGETKSFSTAAGNQAGQNDVFLLHYTVNTAVVATGDLNLQTQEGTPGSLRGDSQQIVTDWFLTFLDRLPTAQELASHVSALDSGADQEALLAAVLGGAEYFNLNGGTNSGFLSALFNEALERPISAAEQSFLDNALQSGMSREEVASTVLNSVEYQNLIDARGIAVATFVDQGSSESTGDFAASIDWGDGSDADAGILRFRGGQFLVGGNHVYADDGEYTVTVAISKNGGNPAFVSSIVTVANVAPTLTISGPAAVDEGSPYVLNLSSFDPGDDAIDHWIINWGDGNVETIPGNPATATHVYADGPNAFNITATATDEDGTFAARGLSAPVPADIVNWWPGDEVATDAIGSNDGVLQNGATIASGFVGEAFGFDGVDDAVVVPDSPSLNFASSAAITLELWAFRTGNAALGHLFGKREGCSEATNYQMWYSQSEGLAFGSGNGQNVTTGIQLALNTWTHLAATFEEGTYRFYVNGQLAAIASGKTLGPITTAPFKIGGSGTCAAFGGLIDELSLYSRALAGAEIQAMYQAGSAGKSDGTVLPVAVNNVAPTLTISGPAAVNEGSPYTLDLSAIDPGDDTIDHWTINWGDGMTSTVGNVAQAMHAYADPGLYEISATATDGDDTFAAGNTISVGVQSAPLTATGAAGPVGTITEFFVPTDDANPYLIITGPDGKLWFTESAKDKIGRIDPLTGVIEEFTTPAPDSRPVGMTVGPDGNIWFTETRAHQIGRIDMFGNIVEFPIPTPNGHPGGITVGPDGNLWFTEYDAAKIARFEIATSTFTEYLVPTPNSLPAGIVAGPDGNLWFTEQAGNKIGRINPATGVITEFSVPTAASQPFGLAFGPDGKLWFVEVAGNKIGRLDPATGTFTEFPLATANSVPAGIIAGPDGAMWFSKRNSPPFGRITMVGQITEFGANTPNARAVGITVGPDGNIWLANNNTDFGGVRLYGVARILLQPASEGNALEGLVATFADPGVAQDVSEYSATIDWGDGQVTAGTIHLIAHDTFSVTGSHVYGDNGLYTVNVTIDETDGSSGMTSANVDVQDVLPAVTIDEDGDPQTAPGTFVLTTSGNFVGSGSFIPAAVDTVISATVSYGDGSPEETLDLDGEFILEHVYVDEGTFTITVSVTDEDGSTGVDTALVFVVLPDPPPEDTGEEPAAPVEVQVEVFVLPPVVLEDTTLEVTLETDDGDPDTEEEQLVGVSIQVNAGTVTGGAVAVLVASYEENPINQPGAPADSSSITFEISVPDSDVESTVTAEPIAVYDMRVTNGEGLTMTVSFAYTLRPEDPEGTTPILTYYDSATDSWQAVIGSDTTVNPCPENTDPLAVVDCFYVAAFRYVVDKVAHTITAVFDGSSTPLIVDFGGTVFTVSVITPPTTVTTSPFVAVAMSGSTSGVVTGLPRQATFTSSSQLTLALTASQDSRLSAGSSTSFSPAGNGGAVAGAFGTGEVFISSEVDFIIWLWEFGGDDLVEQWFRIQQGKTDPKDAPSQGAQTPPRGESKAEPQAPANGAPASDAAKRPPAAPRGPAEKSGPQSQAPLPQSQVDGLFAALTNSENLDGEEDLARVISPMLATDLHNAPAHQRRSDGLWALAALTGLGSLYIQSCHPRPNRRTTSATQPD